MAIDMCNSVTLWIEFCIATTIIPFLVRCRSWFVFTSCIGASLENAHTSLNENSGDKKVEEKKETNAGIIPIAYFKSCHKSNVKITVGMLL